MTARQEHQWARLVHMGYRPVMTGNLTNGSVCVAVARKLDVGALPLLITPDGNLSPEHIRDRQLTTTR